MKRAVTYIMLFFLAAVLSCSREENMGVRTGDAPIRFSTYCGGATRAAAITTANISNFGVAAYSGTELKMDNQLIEGGSGSWAYSPLKYWPQGGALYFSAYAPYATASNGITPSYNTSTRSFDLSYVMPADEADQVDLLMAANVDVPDCSAAPDLVRFTFSHILSRIGFTARYTGAASPGTTVTLTGISFSGKFMQSGDYTVSGGWANQAASASEVTYDRPAAKLAATSLTTSAQNLLTGDNYIMLIPNGDVEMKGTITVSYKIKTSDNVEMTYTKTAVQSLSYQPNRTYIYNIIIALDEQSIIFDDVIVNGWDQDAVIVSDGLRSDSQYLAVFGDTQVYTSTSNYAIYYEKSISWLIEKLSIGCPIKAVLNTGDVTETNGIGQWNVFKSRTNILAQMVPYYAVTGNHDYDWDASSVIHDRLSSKINEYAHFPTTDAGIIATYENGRIENYIADLNLDDSRVKLIALEYVPRPGAVEWAKDYVESHPDDLFILLTHEWLNRNGVRRDDKDPCGGKFEDPGEYSTAEQVWQTLVKPNDNIRCVLCGHSIFHAEYYSENDAGRQVPQIMFNLQSEPNGGDGLLLIWEFPKDSKDVNLSIIDTKTQQKYAREDYNVSFRFFD